MIQTSKSIPVAAGRHYSVIAIVGVIGLAITFVPQGMWSALVVLNL
jgi:hypothetical protein